MPLRIKKLGQFACLILLASLPAAAQLRPETTQPAEKKPAAKPTRIVVETSPGAQVYLEDAFKGQASSEGRLVIENPKPGEHTVRVSLAGKKDYEEKVTVAAGKESLVKARLAEAEPPPAAHQPAPGAGAEGGHMGPPLQTTRVAKTVAAGSVRQNSKDGLNYVWIPAGTFQMGCSPGDSECGPFEKPAHQVIISRGFWMGQTEVTVAAFQRFATATGRQMPLAPDFNFGWANTNMPIVNVSWNDSQAYCQWSGGRLPTEAEWEYAARGGSTEARYGPLDDVAWNIQNSGNRLHNVAQKRANGFGLYDMLGNVFEWVNDWYDANYYQNSLSQDPSGPSSGQTPVLRGGSFDYYPGFVRISNRNVILPGGRNPSLGFRCVGEANVP